MSGVRDMILDTLKDDDRTKRGDILDKLKDINSGTIDKNLQRLKDEKMVDVKTEKGIAYYTISKLGKITIDAKKRKAEKRKADILKNTEKINDNFRKEEKNYTKENAARDLEVFFSEVLYAKITVAEKVIVLDLAEILRFKLELYDFAYNTPNDFLMAADDALRNVQTIGEPLQVRINDSEAEPLPLASINRVDKSYQLIVFEGMISTIDKVRPYTTLAEWECRACGEKIPKETDADGIMRPPYMCECGNRQSFEIVGRMNQNRQYITISERVLSISPEEVNGYVSGELVNDIEPHQRKLLSGNIARFYAISETINPVSNRQIKATAKTVAKIINYEMVEETFEDINLTKEDIEKIKKFSEKKNILSVFASAIDESLIGSEYTPIKQAIVLQFFGGSTDNEEGHHGNIHIAIIGDPGKGKTTFLLNVISFAPKAMYAVGTSATGKGLMACLDKNEVTKENILRPGPFVRCNGGLIGVDEVDKMTGEDIQYMGEALQNGTFTFTKAGIHAILDANTSCLLSANPKYLQFDLNSPIPPQINIPPNIQDRFDLKFLLWDKPDARVDYDLARSILQNKKRKKTIDRDFVRKYIAYARSNYNPTIPDDVNHYISTFYQKFRNSKKREADASLPIPITARQVYSLKKLSEASAKMRLSDTVSIEDAKDAKRLFMVCMDQLGYDEDTGNYDTLAMNYHQLRSLIDKEKKVMETIDRLSRRNKNGVASEQDINDELKTYGFDFGVIADIIDKLKKKGDIFAPQLGFVKSR